MNKIIFSLVTGLLAAHCFGAVADTLRDPTKPLGLRTIVSSNADLKLQAIISRNSEHVAVVNGEMITEGGELAGRLLVKIADKYVVFNDKGKLQKLFLREDIYNAK